MAGSSGNSSFIPKRGTQKRRRRVRNGNVYILTIVSYIILFTTLVASAGVFVYGQYVSGQLQNEIAQMNAAVSNFKEADMQRVQEFDVRLRQANQRLNNSVSVTSIFAAIESATIDTVRFDNLSLARNLDEGFVINAVLETDTFDSSIFQRGIYDRNEVVSAIEFDQIEIQEVVNQSGLSIGQSVTFVANLAVPLAAVPYEVVQTASAPISIPVVPDPEPVVELEAEETTTEEVTSETDV